MLLSAILFAAVFSRAPETMADPSLQSLCCTEISLFNRNISYQLSVFHEPSYHVTALMSASLGIVGAVFQMAQLYRSSAPRFQHFSSGLRAKSILSWLALSNLTAAVAVLLRSVSWLVAQRRYQTLTLEPVNATVCSLISGFTQYSYMCTHMWTLVYAIDACRVAVNLPYAARTYHLCGWGIPAVLSLTGLSILYSCGFECIKFNAYARLLPNHVLSYVPLLVTMVTAPVLLHTAVAKAEQILVNRFARYTLAERRLIELLKCKYFLIIGGFFLCWSPNIINAVLLWSLWHRLPILWVTINWYLMAILNPLQALLNVFLYQRKSAHSSQLNFRELISSFSLSLRTMPPVPREETPLLL